MLTILKITVSTRVGTVVYSPGDVASFNSETAAHLVTNGLAEAVVEKIAKPQSEKILRERSTKAVQ